MMPLNGMDFAAWHDAQMVDRNLRLLEDAIRGGIEDALSVYAFLVLGT